MSFLTDQIRKGLDGAGVLYVHRSADKPRWSQPPQTEDVLGSLRGLLGSLNGLPLIRTRSQHVRVVKGHALDVRPGKMVDNVFVASDGTSATVISLSTGFDSFIVGLGDQAWADPNAVRDFFWHLPRPFADRVAFLDRLDAIGVSCVVVTPQEDYSPPCIVLNPLPWNLSLLDNEMPRWGPYVLPSHCNIHADQRSQRFLQPSTPSEMVRPLKDLIGMYRYAPVGTSDGLVVELYLGDEPEEAFETLAFDADPFRSDRGGQVLIANSIRERWFLEGRAHPQGPDIGPPSLADEM